MTLTPEEREALSAVLRFAKDHPATFLRYIGGGDSHATALQSLRDRLDKAEPAAWVNVDRYGDHSYFGINQLPPGKHHLFTAPPAPAAPRAQDEWRCFHCGDVFTDEESAADHFGAMLHDTPACKLAPDFVGLVKIIRQQESDLRVFREEETESYREFYRLGAKHAVALREEEEKGYVKGLADGRALAAAIGDKTC